MEKKWNKRPQRPVIQIVSLLSLSLLLIFSSSCVVADEQELIEQLLKKVDVVDGEMTITTDSGEKVTITISKDGSSEEEDKCTEGEKTGKSGDVDWSSILPSICSIEDVFKVLGKWEHAYEFKKKGLVWSHIAAELGYTKESMYAELMEIAEQRLKEAKESGIITQELFDKKIGYFSEIAEKWTNKVFADTSEYVDWSSILPSINSIEDVFKVLGKWEYAYEFKKKGLVWSHIAAELGYTKESMYAELMEITKQRLKEAKESGIIGQDLVDKKITLFSETAEKWTNKVFADTSEYVDWDSILPSINSIEDVFKVLGVWEDAYELKKLGAYWSHVAAELNYTKESIYAELMAITEHRLKEAKESGMISQKQFEEKLAYFSEIAEKWTNKVFAE